jgi:hypothetical protein
MNQSWLIAPMVLAHLQGLFTRLIDRLYIYILYHKNWNFRIKPMQFSM